MDKKSEHALVKELDQLQPLVGKWMFTGSFGQDDSKRVEGWESYEIIRDGSALLCQGQVWTIYPDRQDKYANSMEIGFDHQAGRILGEDWEFKINLGKLTIQNDQMRFSAMFDETGTRLTGKWEKKSGTGEWNYWYDKVMQKLADPA